MQKTYNITTQESQLLEQHLSRLTQLQSQISALREELSAVCTNLQIVWEGIYRRLLLERALEEGFVSRDELDVPPVIEDGRLAIKLLPSRQLQYTYGLAQEDNDKNKEACPSTA